MGIYVKFWHFYDVRSPNIAMSRDSRSKFRRILFFPDSALNIRKSYKICSRKALYFRSYQPETSRGWKTPPSVLLGLRTRKHYFILWGLIQKTFHLYFKINCSLMDFSHAWTLSFLWPYSVSPSHDDL